MSQSCQFDVAVIGSGAAGLSAALRAAVSGAKVVVLEKAAVIGGSTAMSGGCIWVPQHHHMAALGVSDSRQDALRYIRAVSPEGWHNTEEPLWTAFVDHAPAMLRFLETHSPARFIPNREPDPYAEAPGGMAFGRNVSPAPMQPAILGPWSDKIRPRTTAIPLNYEELVDSHFFANPKKHMVRLLPRLAWRWLRGVRTMGNALAIGLLKGCLDHGVEIWPMAAAKRLLLQNGRVTGLELERARSTLEIHVTMAVVLASGGFEWNAEMMEKYFPGPVEWTASPRTNSGDGQRMAVEAGAQLDHMDQALIMGTIPTLYEGKIQGQPAADYFLPHSMIVNRYGRRFMNEKEKNAANAFTDLDPQTGTPRHLPAWRIYDGQFAAKYSHALPSKSVSGNYFRADSLEELASQIGVDPVGLTDTARRFSAFARAGRDDEFGRGGTIWDRNRGGDPSHTPNPTLGTIERPPFYAMPFKAGFIGTKGGPRTNEKAEVLRPDGRPIQGLYAAGNVMANCFGSKAIGAGSTLGPCLTWGYIAALNAVAPASD